MSENNRSIGLNELVDYQKKTYSPFMDKVMRFLWKCAGADAQILQYSPYSDHIKNAGIGGVVLATSVMAALAMGFAMHTIFESQWLVTLPVALVWGLIIFNLDRFIVSTVKGDGTEKITLQEFWSMLPRLFMAVLIGLTISAPLETYIFSKEINREWHISMEKLAFSKVLQLDISRKATSDGLDNLFIEKEKSLIQQQNKVDEFKRIADDESDKNIAGRKGGQGEVWKRKNAEYEFQVKLLDSIKRDLRVLEKERNDFKLKTKHLKDSTEKATIKDEPGFLDQIMMLEKLASEGKVVERYDPKTKEPILKQDNSGKKEYEKDVIYESGFWPIWLVRLLFMIVEIAPVIFKFMIWKSSYDYMQDNVAQILEAKQGISLECITDENNNMHKIRENYNARRIVEVAKRQNELEKENAIHAITVYAERERKEIDRDPDQFVRSNDKT